MGVRHKLSALALAALGVACMLAAQPTTAQIPLTAARPDPNDPDAVLVEELVVRGRLPGPAWWTVSDADTTVYVLGSPSLAPRHMDWDRAVFETRLKGANAVILPFQQIRVTVGGAFAAAVPYLRLRSGTPFEETLEPPARARFVALRTRLGQPASHYGTRSALAAGLILANDNRERTGLTVTDPTKLIRLLARQARVPILQKSYEIGPLMGAIARTPALAARTCLDEVMSTVEAGPAGTIAAARAWAQGDVRGALGNERTFERCIAGVPGVQAFDAQVKADQVAAIETALKTPGHAIAVVQLRPLLAQGGVLDRLRAKGFAVTTPGDEE